MSVLLTIPGASASSSKMAKKGWKCWAKWVSKVNTPATDGYAYQGEFTAPGSSVECEPGDLLLHVDQSSGAAIGIVTLNAKGAAFINWIETADSDTRKWCGPLAKTARKICEMSHEQRIQFSAQNMVANRPDTRSDAVHAHYVAMAGLPAAIAVDVEALRAERGQLAQRMAEIDAILSTVQS